MSNRNEQFEICRSEVDAFVRKVIVIRTEVAEKEATVMEAIATMVKLAVTPEQKLAVAKYIRLTGTVFGLEAMQIEMQLDSALHHMDVAASPFTGPSGRFLRRHIQRARDQIDAVKADCERIKGSLVA